MTGNALKNGFSCGIGLLTRAIAVRKWTSIESEGLFLEEIHSVPEHSDLVGYPDLK